MVSGSAKYKTTQQYFRKKTMSANIFYFFTNIGEVLAQTLFTMSLKLRVNNDTAQIFNSEASYTSTGLTPDRWLHP